MAVANGVHTDANGIRWITSQLSKESYNFHPFDQQNWKKRFRSKVLPGPKSGRLRLWHEGDVKRVAIERGLAVADTGSVGGAAAVNAPQPEAVGGATVEYFVTLQQAAAMVNRSKKTLERRKASGMPMPKVSWRPW